MRFWEDPSLTIAGHIPSTWEARGTTLRRAPCPYVDEEQGPLSRNPGAVMMGGAYRNLEATLQKRGSASYLIPLPCEILRGTSYPYSFTKENINHK